jgi:hypothetical protein
VRPKTKIEIERVPKPIPAEKSISSSGEIFFR